MNKSPGGNCLAYIQSLASRRSVETIISSTPGLTEVEEIIRSKFASDSRPLREIPEYLLKLGGKRLRPLLAILSARLFGMQSPSPQLLDVSAGIELIHMATLLHDDIIDKSPLRRHKQSPYLRFGIPATLIAGDFLLTRAFSLCARLDRFIIDQTELACIELTEGEIEETPLSESPTSMQQILEIARKKTAALFKLAALSGSHLAEASANATSRMGEFGTHMGIAFQIIDDILDVTSSESMLGKRPGQDLREQKPSVVNSLWLQTGSGLAKEVLQLKGDAQSREPLIEQAIKEVLTTGVIERAREMAAEHSQAALQSLQTACQEAGTLCRGAADDMRSLVSAALGRLR